MKKTSVIVMLALLLTSMFAVPFAVADSDDDEIEISLSSENRPSMVVELNGESYTIELISASDSAATIRVTDSSGNADQKEINEGSEKSILNLEIEVEEADESNFNLVAVLEIEFGDNNDSDEDNSDDSEDRPYPRETPASARAMSSASLTEVYAQAGISLDSDDESHVELDDDSKRIFIAHYGYGEGIRFLLIERKKIDSGDSDSLTAAEFESDFRGAISIDGDKYRLRGDSLTDLEIKHSSDRDGLASIDVQEKTIFVSFENGESVEYKLSEFDTKVIRTTGVKVSDSDSVTQVTKRIGFWERWFNSNKEKNDDSIVDSDKPEKLDNNSGRGNAEDRKSFTEWFKRIFSRSNSDSDSNSLGDDDSDSDSDDSVTADASVTSSASAQPVKVSGIAKANTRIELGI